MTTARDAIRQNFNTDQVAAFNTILDWVVRVAPDSVRLEMAAMLLPANAVIAPRSDFSPASPSEDKA